MKTFVLAACLTLAAAPAPAQDGRGVFAAGSVSAVNMESNTDVAYAGSFGFRFSRVASLVVETTAVPHLHSGFPINTPILLSGTPVSGVLIYPGPQLGNESGRIVLLTNAVRIDIPTTSARVTPFFSAGGGGAHIRRTTDLVYPVPLPLQPGNPPGQVRQITQHFTASQTELALTLGGGAGIRLTSSLWLDVDLRLYRLLGDEDQNLGRFGVGARYGF